MREDTIFGTQQMCPGIVWGLESLELNQIQGLEILEFYKVVLKSLEFNCGETNIYLSQLS